MVFDQKLSIIYKKHITLQKSFELFYLNKHLQHTTFHKISPQHQDLKKKKNQTSPFAKTYSMQQRSIRGIFFN